MKAIDRYPAAWAGFRKIWMFAGCVALWAQCAAPDEVTPDPIPDEVIVPDSIPPDEVIVPDSIPEEVIPDPIPDPEPVIISESGIYHIDGEKVNVTYIEVNPGITADITLRNVHIERTGRYECAFSIEKADVTLHLEGSNSFFGGYDTPGIELLGGSLAINGPGTLEATGNAGGAGIGNGGIRGSELNHLESVITIHSGTVIANGGRVGAGIGGGYYSSGNTTSIVVNGGDITARGSEWGDAIGWGYNNTSTIYITINGGTVYADGSRREMFVSGGYGLRGNGITVNGGLVTAIGYKYFPGIYNNHRTSSDLFIITGGCVMVIDDVNNYEHSSADYSIEGWRTSCSGGTIIAANGIQYVGSISGNSIVFNNRDSFSYSNEPEAEEPAILLMKPEIAVDPQGNITLNANLAIPPGSTLTSPPGCTFTLSQGVTLTNGGAVENYGTIDARNGKLAGAAIRNMENGSVW
jgi:hypothetical protein